MLGRLFLFCGLISRVGVMMNSITALWSGRMRAIGIIGLPFLWALCIFLFMNVTSPLQSGPLSVLAVFVLVYLLITSTLYAGIIVGHKVAGFLGWRRPLHRKQLYYLVSVIGLAPVFFLALNTLGQLEIKEVLLVILLLAMGCFYVMRRGRKGSL
jgi:hypothetical protein